MLNTTTLSLDENISWRVARGLNQAGYSVTTIGEHSLASLHDTAIFQFAQSQGYVLVTRDSDFLTRFFHHITELSSFTHKLKRPITISFKVCDCICPRLFNETWPIL